MKISCFLIFILMPLITYPSVNTGKSNIPEYNLTLHFIPDSSVITGKAEIINPPDSVFRLLSCLNIESVKADGREIFPLCRSTKDNSGDNIYSTGCIPGKLIIEWSGRISPGDIPTYLNNQNMIGPGLIELTDHISWYPGMMNTNGFRYLLTAYLPDVFTVVTNGMSAEEDHSNGRNHTVWKSGNTAYGISLVAARNMKITKAKSDGFSLEIYHTSLPGEYIDSMSNDLAKTLSLYNKLYGSHRACDVVRIVYSPRSAGGYARAPLIVVSENYALEQLHSKYGYDRDFHLNAHEIAHYWSKADTWSSDDWINEGLAEYSALLASEKIIGKDFADFLLDEDKSIVSNSATSLSILETPGDSWERDINRYYKPTLLLNNIRKQYGDEIFFSFLRSLEDRFASNGKATTPGFLEVLGNSIGPQAQDYMTEALSRKKWLTDGYHPQESFSPADTLLKGTWTGDLTQFGSTSKFVLQLKAESGILVPSLDSPDQNAFGIPASDLYVKGDTISFRVSVASASFKGAINRSVMLINGYWIQRGTNYPLVLLKSE